MSSFMNFKETMLALDYLFEAGLTPNLIGETGIGKTELLAQYTMNKGMDLIPLHVSQIEPSDLVGLYKTTEDDRTMTCPPNWLPYKASSKEDKSKQQTNKESIDQLRKIFTGEINPNGGVIFLDEVNRGHEDIRQAIYQLVNERRVHTYVLPANYYIAAASNPGSQGYEVNEFDDALMNRFAWIKFRPDTTETIGYLSNKHGNNILLDWVKSDPSLIEYGSDDWDVEDGLRFSPRIMEKAIKLYKSIKTSRKGSKEFTRKLFCSFMKEDLVAGFMAYAEQAELISFQDVIDGVNKKELKKLIDEKQNAHLATIVRNLSDIFATYEVGVSKGCEYFDEKDESVVIERVTSFIGDCGEEYARLFLEGLEEGFSNPKSIVKTKAFLNNVGMKMVEFAKELKKNKKG